MLVHQDAAGHGGESKTRSHDRVGENGSMDDVSDDNGRSNWRTAYTWLCTLLLLINYFLAQYDKFILSYFQTPLSESLDLYIHPYHSPPSLHHHH